MAESNTVTDTHQTNPQLGWFCFAFTHADDLWPIFTIRYFCQPFFSGSLVFFFSFSLAIPPLYDSHTDLNSKRQPQRPTFCQGYIAYIYQRVWNDATNLGCTTQRKVKTFQEFPVVRINIELKNGKEITQKYVEKETELSCQTGCTKYHLMNVYTSNQVIAYISFVVFDPREPFELCEDRNGGAEEPVLISNVPWSLFSFLFRITISFSYLWWKVCI